MLTNSRKRTANFNTKTSFSFENDINVATLHNIIKVKVILSTEILFLQTKVPQDSISKKMFSTTK